MTDGEARALVEGLTLLERETLLLIAKGDKHDQLSEAAGNEAELRPIGRGWHKAMVARGALAVRRSAPVDLGWWLLKGVVFSDWRVPPIIQRALGITPAMSDADFEALMAAPFVMGGP